MPRQYLLPLPTPGQVAENHRGRMARTLGWNGRMPVCRPPALRSEPAVRPARVVIAVLLALVGAAWTLQGLGVIGGSAMSGTLFWAGAGIVIIIGAGAVLAAE